MTLYDTDGGDYEDRESENDINLSPICPKCEVQDAFWRGGDWVLNVGSGMERVDWYTCTSCLHKFTVSDSML